MIARRYTERLSQLRLEDHLAEPVANRVAWLSGQSSYHHSQLSPTQLGLLESTVPLGFTLLLAGFPYNRATLAEPWRREPLVAASIRNSSQYLAARRNPRFRAELVRHLAPLFTRTSNRLILLCGSAGLELLSATLSVIDIPPRLSALAIALGPVTRQPFEHSRVRLHTIQGRGDWISRLGFPAPPSSWVGGSHLDYAASPEVRALVRDLARGFAL